MEVVGYVLFAIVIYAVIGFLVNAFKQDGYRYSGTEDKWGLPTAKDPDPSQKEPLRSMWEANGYKWDEINKEWRLPTKTQEELDREFGEEYKDQMLW